MRRRIVGVALVTATVALVLFVVPLGVAVRQLYIADEHSELERAALSAAVAVDPAFAAGDPVELPRGEAGVEVSLYNAAGQRVAGVGPSRPDPPTSAALAGRASRSQRGGTLVATIPVSANEKVIGAVRAATPIATIWRRILLTWLGMAALAAVAIAVAVAVARRQARGIARPLEELAAASQVLGDGDFSVRTSRSGIEEIDQAGQALNVTASRLGDLMARERAFAANASHQLRTPLTGLRLRLESGLEGDPAELPAAALEALKSTDQLEQTIDDLIALSAPPRPNPLATTVAVIPLLDQLGERWRGQLAAAGRPLRLALPSDELWTTASPRAVRQILDIIIDNAVRHARGTVTVQAREAGTAIAVDVLDEGPGISPTLGDVFQRGVSGGLGHGIGLALASGLARDQNGRLLLTQSSPAARFTLLIPGPGAETEETVTDRRSADPSDGEST